MLKEHEFYEIKNNCQNSMKGLQKMEFKKDKMEHWRDEKISAERMKAYKAVYITSYLRHRILHIHLHLEVFAGL